MTTPTPAAFSRPGLATVRIAPWETTLRLPTEWDMACGDYGIPQTVLGYAVTACHVFDGDTGQLTGFALIFQDWTVLAVALPPRSTVDTVTATLSAVPEAGRLDGTPWQRLTWPRAGVTRTFGADALLDALLDVVRVRGEKTR